MKRLSKVVVIALIVVVLAACGAVDNVVTREVVVGEETVTAVPPLTLPNTPTPTATPTPSRTPVPTDIPLPTLFATSTWTPEPSPTPRPTKTPYPTIDFNREFAWSNEVAVMSQFTGHKLVWSPSHNEFVYIIYPKQDNPQVLFTDAINFQPIDITPTGFLSSVNICWHPSGDYFFLSGKPIDLETIEELGWGVHSWKVESINPNPTYLGLGSYYWGWLNNDLRISHERVGTGTYSIEIFNVTTKQSISHTYFEGNIEGTSQNYVILNEDLGYTRNSSVAVLAQEVINFSEHAEWEGEYVKFLSSRFDEDNAKRPYNRFADIFPTTDQVLVITWEERIDDSLNSISGSVPVNLQLWDVESDTLTMIVPGGVYGRYSPDGRYLIYLTHERESHQLHLLDQTTGEIIFTQAALTNAYDYNIDVNAYTSFSPNGRFLTFFNPAHELIIYDLESGEFLAPVTAVPATPLWSPDGSRFVYQDPDAGLSIFDKRSATAYPLVISGSDRLSDPQWSFDGTYLSVTLLQEEWWEWETAVLQIP